MEWWLENESALNTEIAGNMGPYLRRASFLEGKKMGHGSM